VRFIKHYKALTAETEGQTSAKSAGEYVVGQQRMAKEGDVDHLASSSKRSCFNAHICGIFDM
jgi:hypothetical protein